VVAGQDGIAIESGDGEYRLQFGLLLHADGRFALGDAQQPLPDQFAVRRFRPYLRGRFGRHFEFYVNPDFAGATLTVQDAYVDTIFSPALRVRAGKGKTPFGLERLYPASNMLFMERALPTALVPNRDIGVQVLGDLRGGTVSYLAGVMNGVPDGGSADIDTNDGKDVSGRLVVRPWSRRTDSSLRGLGFAIAGSRGKQQGIAALPLLRTQTILQPYFSYLGTGVGADGARTRYSPQAFYFHKRFGGWFEFVHTNVPVRRADVREEIAKHAWQIAGSWVLTGEPATDAGTGVRPRANFDFGNGHWGAFQIAARYHALEVDQEAISLGFATPGSSRKAEAWTLGLNWYLTGNLRYTLNFERTVFDDDPDGPRRAENALAFRTQLSF
jgi:phosphate-selective porin OprO/OprP